MMRKRHHSSFLRARSFTKMCAQNLLGVRNHAKKLLKKIGWQLDAHSSTRVLITDGSVLFFLYF